MRCTTTTSVPSDHPLALLRFESHVPSRFAEPSITEIKPYVFCATSSTPDGLADCLTRQFSLLTSHQSRFNIGWHNSN